MSAPLEASAPLDFEDEVTIAPITNTPVARSFSHTAQPQAQKTIIEHDRSNQSVLPLEPLPVEDQQENLSSRQMNSRTSPQIVEEKVIRLLEERLVVDRKRHKVGEVVVRKEIETQIIEVPVRREKLIVEQIGSETRQLAVIDLGHPDLQPKLKSDATVQSASQSTIVGEFVSIKAAIQFLETLAATQPAGDNQTVQVEVSVEKVEPNELDRQRFDR
ncbi:MAG: YsnF/AvaK domain-containing protein [Lyngbya sp. HA4199-MV5]|jgi:hypothetical protein|nr:YsnF/AvaK domain-containing protein [Lyngbya sp. HA4199-MV5]